MNQHYQIKALSKLTVIDLYRRKDLIVVLILTAVLLIPLMFFAPFGEAGAQRYINEIIMLMIWVFSTAVGLGVAARLFPPEFELRTIYPMLAKPVSRQTIISGKYLGALTASLSALLIFYTAYAVQVGLRQGLWVPAVFWQALLLHIAFMVVITAIGLLGSLLFSVSANITLVGVLVVVMILFGQQLPSLAATQGDFGKWAITLFYWLAPHFEFFDLRQRLVHDWEPISWATCILVCLYALCYAVFCLILAGGVFRYKKV